jgi:LEA14-like dessication related protein
MPPLLRPRLLLVSLTAVWLAACAAGGLPDRPPEIHLVGLRPGGGGLFEQAVLLDLRVVNPNRQDIHFDGLTFNLRVNNQHLADGVSNQPVTVPGRGETRLRVTANADTLALVQQLLSLVERRRLDYAISGDVYIDSGIADHVVAYRSAGAIDPMGAATPETAAP